MRTAFYKIGLMAATIGAGIIFAAPAPAFSPTLIYAGFPTAGMAFIAPKNPIPFRCAAPVALDGDTIKCGAVRIRLTGSDAPELAGHCRKGRKCVAGDPLRSKNGLAGFMRGHGIWVTPLGTDKYRRTLATVHRVKPRAAFRRAANAACHQIKTGGAVYVAKWDNGKIIARECGL